ncbi:hypothetical protein [Hyphomicrobium sp. CS1GBMeth3]|uniref:alpha/beta fold hydrolase n=1 Tax=Hyphomicrobium sp. CS1GBMeth3 TaxID=1892845 RepID=UPI0009303DEB|nr:hypothetical protein [Hyphomicrobium sp. CS1GBMeth3]
MSQGPSTDRRRLVLAHGWAVDASVWQPLIERLGFDGDVIHCGPRFLDLGPPTHAAPPDDAICIGFSFGALWLLLNAPARIKALVSISGFTRLDAAANVDAMRALRAGLEKNAPAQVKAFRRLAGIREPVPSEALNVPLLLEGLDAMLEGDARGVLSGLDCPVLALASRDDPVIPPDVTRSSWPTSATRWSEGGGHALPLTQTDWCASEIQRFVREHLS